MVVILLLALRKLPILPLLKPLIRHRNSPLQVPVRLGCRFSRHLPRKVFRKGQDKIGVDCGLTLLAVEEYLVGSGARFGVAEDCDHFSRPKGVVFAFCEYHVVQAR